MKYIFALLFSVIFLSAGCTPTNPELATGDTPIEFTEFAPQPSDEKLTRANLSINKTEINANENEPQNFTAHIVGTLPTPCYELRAIVSPPDTKNQVMVEMYSLNDSSTICTQVILPFEVYLPLGQFKAGQYSLTINKNLVGQFGVK
jgi:hypothetical protein